MTGKKKNMEGGIIGLITKSYNNVTINDLAKKIIEGKHGEKSRWWNRILNNSRAEQRINPFFKKLIDEIESPKQMTDDRINKLLEYFKNIIKKYPDEINKLQEKGNISAYTNKNGHKVYDDDFSKAKNFFMEKGKDKELVEIFKSLRKKNKSGSAQQTTNYTHLRPPKVQQTLNYMLIPENTSAIVPEALSYQNKIDKSYEELIQKLNVIIENEELKKGNLIQKMNMDNKTLILSHISKLANQIKRLVNIYKLPRFKDEGKAKILINKLSGLIFIYRSIMSNNSSNNNQKANNLDSIYTNLTSLNA